ncbi:dihydrolipoyl dehydrogenase family protein [Actinomycetospora straminea]|uniref:NAD(P)/FAD-dependent oxidoreductase n=1 Tax=Actinomycetospora straminea TaxID=663607 RepID=A0ABP9F831_9PSEU|nr:NAD(P)/FAD-dependent oxidoreductase [Actinomycetospora straminea]MDD7934763.1 NAD(P)/FAD-dependent oxidoreductase [Actinomycetospora straminea]
MTEHETQHTDVVVIGLGPGGETAASRLLEAGLGVVGIERELVGGECPYWGCVPSKMIVRAAGTVSEARRVDQLAGSATVRPDVAPVARRIRAEATDGWDDTIAVERFEKLGGQFVRGSARIEAPGRVRVGDQVFAAGRGVVLATGSRPATPPIPGLDTVASWTNREAIAAEVVPPSLVVLGGGAIGLELAQAFARFGSSVTVVEAAEHVLPAEEPEVGDLLAEVLRADGVDLRLGRRAVRVTDGADGPVVDLDDGSRADGTRLLVAVGRRPALDGLGLEHYDIDPRGRAVPVDEQLRAADGLWAIGDVTGVGAFTHLAVYQAEVAAADILARPGTGADYAALARVTFTDPEVGSVGLSEAAARARGVDVATGVAPVAASSRGFIHGPGNAGLVKLVADRATGVLVGATAAGPVGGEVLSMLTLAVHAGVPVEDLRRMHYAYPTFHRGVLDALAGLAAGR